ncbi:MAG: TlpA disulfide reductase family protein [Gammaproteobacteria bacterium]|nr:TlpA disulfide reductase family protein [Gammaproteobacteria bacterium]
MKLKFIASIVLIFVCSIANADRLLDAMPRTMHAENFSLPYSTGGKFNLEDLQGKFVLVNFWTTKCTVCRTELSLMQDLLDQLAEENILQVVAVHAGPDVIGVNEHLELSPVSYPVVMDINLELGHWGVPSLPTSYLLTPEGNFAYRAVGSRLWNSPPMVDFLKKVFVDYEETKVSEK